MSPIRSTKKRIIRFVVHNILHIDDTPHRLALGVGVAFFIAWTPTIGFQMALVLLLAPLFKANARVGLPLVWISNPVTAAFIYYPNYRVGKYILEKFGYVSSTEINFKSITEILTLPTSEGGVFSQIFNMEYWQGIVSFLAKIGLELWAGSIIIGIILGVIMYFVSYKTILWYRAHTPHWARVGKILHLKKKEHQANEKS
ncbi:MAG: DUF2062 domain-containing protein [Phycisphaerae bacterium]|nr:DUF2062 domain-containing protein [Phycisphaerae bacterium]